MIPEVENIITQPSLPPALSLPQWGADDDDDDGDEAVGGAAGRRRDCGAWRGQRTRGAKEGGTGGTKSVAAGTKSGHSRQAGVWAGAEGGRTWSALGPEGRVGPLGALQYHYIYVILCMHMFVHSASLVIHFTYKHVVSGTFGARSLRT